MYNTCKESKEFVYIILHIYTHKCQYMFNCFYYIYIQAFLYIYYSTFAFLKYNIIYTRISLVKFLKMCPVVILLQQNSS